MAYGFLVSQTQRKQLRKNETQEKHSTADILEQEKDELLDAGYFVITYPDEKIIWNAKMFLIFSLHPSAAPPSLSSFLDLIDPSDRDTIRQLLNNETPCTATPIDQEFRILRQNKPYWVRSRMKMISQEDKTKKGIVGAIFTDIDKYKKIQEEIQNMAFKDPLTHLYNGMYLDQVITETMEDPDIKWPIALLHINLNHFKFIDTSLGHLSGNSILQKIAQRIDDIKGPQNVAARLNSDHFVLFLKRTTHSEIRYFAEKILHTISQPITLNSYHYHITASIGIAFAEKNIGYKNLLTHANLAVAEAQKKGDQTICFYSPHLSEVTSQKLLIGEDIRRGIKNNEFVMFYQPRIDLNSNKISCVETLMRWQHPEKGLLSPAYFIPIAEELGLIDALGKISLEHSCEDAVRWRMAGHHFDLSVNVSARQFRTSTIIELVTNILSSTNLPGHALEMEITESLAMENPHQAIAVMKELKSLGLSLALDDFGTGYSSLSSLKRFPLDFLKVDRSFIQDLPHDTENAAITQAICALKNPFKIKIVAEGIESIEQLEMLKTFGVDQIQGYLISPPLPFDEFIPLLGRDFDDNKCWTKNAPKESL